MTIRDIPVKTLTGQDSSLGSADLDGKTHLVVNVASAEPGLAPGRRGQARVAGPRLVIWPAMIIRWISLVPSQIRSTRSSRKKRSATFSRM